MCLTAPARVLEVDSGGVAVVLLGGRQRRASTLVVPEVAVGDWVIVGAGTILERMSDDEASVVSAAVEAATREEG
ncbi:MAG TPA: HypC/HybG/HupF family hydrogenase formation chaperone [Candidatus Limnocylindria bacterium]|nr:HypC/HybG/HupF family hydrogenase formation chaperone [Candidatus Limnocylindria bacterium]